MDDQQAARTKLGATEAIEASEEDAVEVSARVFFRLDMEYIIAELQALVLRCHLRQLECDEAAATRIITGED